MTVDLPVCAGSWPNMGQAAGGGGTDASSAGPREGGGDLTGGKKRATAKVKEAATRARTSSPIMRARIRRTMSLTETRSLGWVEPTPCLQVPHAIQTQQRVPQVQPRVMHWQRGR